MVQKFHILLFCLISSLFLAGCTTALEPTTQSPGTTAAPQPLASTPAQTQPDVQNPDNISASALASAPQPNPTDTVTDSQLTDQPQIAALPPQKSFAFLPLEGAPGAKAKTFSASLQQAAERHALNILPATSLSGANYQVKGYFSALSDGTGTRLVYIWDVTDPASGKRLHRINGEAKNATRSLEAWQAIGNAELARVAEQTAARLKSWVAKR